MKSGGFGFEDILNGISGLLPLAAIAMPALAPVIGLISGAIRMSAGDMQGGVKAGLTNVVGPGLVSMLGDLDLKGLTDNISKGASNLLIPSAEASQAPTPTQALQLPKSQPAFDMSTVSPISGGTAGELGKVAPPMPNPDYSSLGSPSASVAPLRQPPTVPNQQTLNPSRTSTRQPDSDKPDSLKMFEQLMAASSENPKGLMLAAALGGGIQGLAQGLMSLANRPDTGVDHPPVHPAMARLGSIKQRIARRQQLGRQRISQLGGAAVKYKKA